MRSSQRNWCLGAVAAAAAVAAFWLAPSGPGVTATPRGTIEAFLHASATGDARTACSLLSAHARTQVTTGATCVAGIRSGASLYGAIIRQIRPSKPVVHGSTASAISTLDGRPTAGFALRKHGASWQIVGMWRMKPAVATAAGSGSPGPSEARVAAVAGCLDGAVGAVDNGGLDDSGGATHAILSVETAGSTAAEVDVFSSALAALSGYKAIGADGRGLTTRLASTSVIVYLKQLPAAARRKLEACA